MSHAAFELLENSLHPVTECLTPQAARRMVAMRASDEVQHRIDELADKSNEGELSADERTEYEMFVWVGQYISGLQASARKMLAQA